MKTATLKFNNGNGAILCSECNVIVKDNNFTEDEKKALIGEIKLEPYHCMDCDDTPKTLSIADQHGEILLECEVGDKYHKLLLEVGMNKVLEDAIERINKPRKDKITGEEVKPINSYFTTDLGKPAKDGYTKNFWGETIELKSFSTGVFVELPEELLKELKWKAGDEIEVSSTENCFDWGEVKSMILRNLSKEK